MPELSNNRVGALLIHGLGGTQYDLGSLQQTLRRNGVESHTLTLPGHGGQPKDLLGVTAEEWFDAVRSQYRELLAQYDTLHVIGICMGALLAIELVKRERHQCGKLVALSTPVYIDGWSTPWYRALRHLVYKLPALARKMQVVEEEPFGIKSERIRAIVKAKFERNPNIHYPWVPLYCIGQVDRLRGWVMAGLGHIACPTLVVHSREDELTSLRSAEYLARHIASDKIDVVVLENSYHMICVDHERDIVAGHVLRHLELPLRHTVPAAMA